MNLILSGKKIQGEATIRIWEKSEPYEGHKTQMKTIRLRFIPLWVKNLFLHLYHSILRLQTCTRLSFNIAA